MHLRLICFVTPFGHLRTTRRETFIHHLSKDFNFKNKPAAGFLKVSKTSSMVNRNCDLFLPIDDLMFVGIDLINIRRGYFHLILSTSWQTSILKNKQVGRFRKSWSRGSPHWKVLKIHFFVFFSPKSENRLKTKTRHRQLRHYESSGRQKICN